MSLLDRKMSYEKGIAARRFHLVAVVTLAMAAAGSANAALIGVTQTFPDATLTASPYLIYDHNAINANTGLLTIYTGASTLTESVAAGGSSITQPYLTTGSDTTPDLMLSIQINNSTGAWVGGNVGITYGNVSTSPRFAWTGTITNFGFQADGKLFDATWHVTNDQYQNMPASLSQFVNGYLTGTDGGIKFSNSYGFGTGSFASDWMFGSSAATTTALNSYITGLDLGFLRANSTVTADVFTVPLPGAVWLLGSGLLALGRISLRSKSGTEQI